MLCSRVCVCVFVPITSCLACSWSFLPPSSDYRIVDVQRSGVSETVEFISLDGHPLVLVFAVKSIVWLMSDTESSIDGRAGGMERGAWNVFRDSLRCRAAAASDFIRPMESERTCAVPGITLLNSHCWTLEPFKNRIMDANNQEKNCTLIIFQSISYWNKFLLWRSCHLSRRDFTWTGCRDRICRWPIWARTGADVCRARRASTGLRSVPSFVSAFRGSKLKYRPSKCLPSAAEKDGAAASRYKSRQTLNRITIRRRVRIP